MNKERRKKHCTTPRPPNIKKIIRRRSNEKNFILIDFGKKEIYKEILNITKESHDLPHSSSDKSNSSWESTDPFRFTSEESKSTDGLDEESDEQSSDDEDPFKSEESSEDSGDTTLKALFMNSSTRGSRSSSPEKMRYSGNFFSEEEIAPVIFPGKIADFLDSDINFDAPKLASTPVQCSNESDIYSRKPNLESTKHGTPPKNKETIIDSTNSKHGNISPTIPLKINETYIEAPDCPDFEAADVENAEVEISPIDLNEMHEITLVNTENQDGQEYQESSAKCSKRRRGSLNVSPISFRCNYAILPEQPVENAVVSCITTINTQDIVDSVFKNSNDTSSPKLNDAVMDFEDISRDQLRQITEEEGVNDVPKNASGMLKRKRKSHKKSGIRSRKQTSSGRIATKSLTDEERRKYIEYLKTIPVCPLTLKKTLLSPLKDREINNDVKSEHTSN